MMAKSAYGVLSLLIGMSLAIIFTGCAGRTLSTSVSDQALVPGPPKAEAPKPAPAPVPEAPKVAEEKPAEPVPPPSPKAELRVPEPAPPPIAAAAPPVEPTPEALPPAPPAPEVSLPPPPAAAVPPPAPPAPAPVAPPAAPPFVLSDVLFDYDRFTLRNNAKAALEQNARVLKAQKDAKILIEGHCDERGTVDYNLVLGERRARAVKQYLEDLGVPPSSLKITSYGKEKPFCTEHSDACWQQNRRAHFERQ